MKPYFMTNKKWYREISKEQAEKYGLESINKVLTTDESIPFEAEVSYAKYANLGAFCLYRFDDETGEVLEEDIFRGKEDTERFNKLYFSDFM